MSSSDISGAVVNSVVADVTEVVADVASKNPVATVTDVAKLANDSTTLAVEVVHDFSYCCGLVKSTVTTKHS